MVKTMAAAVSAAFRTYQAGREVRGRYNGELFDGEKGSNRRVQYEQVEIDLADWASTYPQPSGVWVATQT